MNQKYLWIALITLIVAIFVFAQVYILFAVTQTNNRLVQLEDRIDKRFTELETRIDKRLTELETRIDKRFVEVNQQITGLRSDMNQRLSDMDANIRQLNQNYSNHLAHHIDGVGKE